MDLRLFAGSWLVLFLCLVVVTFVRLSVGRQEDDHIHVFDADNKLVSTQSAIAHRLDLLDRWRTILMVVVLISGLMLAGLYLYGVWQEGATSHFQTVTHVKAGGSANATFQYDRISG